MIKSNSIADSANIESNLLLNEESNKKISSILKKPELADKIYISGSGKEKTIEIHRPKREQNIEIKKVNKVYDYFK